MSEHNHSINAQMCHFCHHNNKVAYYCEDCGASSCSDCLETEKSINFSCKECFSKNIEIKDAGEKQICKECGSENIKT